MWPNLLNNPCDYKTKEVLVKKFTHQDNNFYLFIPKGVDLNSSPVILFLHGLAPSSPVDYKMYSPLIFHEAKRGNIVIFLSYQKGTFSLFRPKVFPLTARQVLKEAILEIKKIAPKNDLSQFIVIGSSMGGAVATNILSEEIPLPKAIILITPGETFPYLPASIYGLPFGDLRNLNPETWFVALFSQSDRLVLREKVKKKLLQKTEGLNRHMFLIPSDAYGNPPLWSNHVSAFYPPNNLSYYGYRKIIDATIDCALFNKNCEVVKGENKEALEIGFWSDGRKINQIKKIY
ncbi:alpha/beta hydrolase [bacterium]|nr:alpha/beta hydrolase [bacterium]